MYRVAITGLGILTAIGQDKQTYWNGLMLLRRTAG